MQKTGDGKLLPILTDIAAASENLLNDIKCNCKSDCQSAHVLAENMGWSAQAHAGSAEVKAAPLP